MIVRHLLPSRATWIVAVLGALVLGFGVACGVLSAIGEPPSKGVGNLCLGFALCGLFPAGMVLPFAALAERRPVPRLVIAGLGPVLLLAAGICFELSMYFGSDGGSWRPGGGFLLCTPTAGILGVVPFLLGLRLRSDLAKIEAEARFSPLYAAFGDRASVPASDAARLLGIDPVELASMVAASPGPRLLHDEVQAMVHGPERSAKLAGELAARLRARGALEVRGVGSELGVSPGVVRAIVDRLVPPAGRVDWDEGWIYRDRDGGLLATEVPCSACGATFRWVAQRPSTCASCGTVHPPPPK